MKTSILRLSLIQRKLNVLSPNDVNLSICLDVDEIMAHTFLSCHKIDVVWKPCYAWSNKVSSFSNNVNEKNRNLVCHMVFNFFGLYGVKGIR